MLGAVGFAIAFALLNRARGSKLFDLTKSTQFARIASTHVMAALVLACTGSLACGVWAWATLYLWALFGWGKYAGAAIGVGLNRAEREFPPVDWVMERLPITDERLWGAVAMSLRMLLALPCTLGLAYLTDGASWPSLFVPLMGAVYVPCGHHFGARGWKYSEYCAGGILGVVLYLTVV